MRYVISILFVIATLLTGCHSPSMVHPQASAAPVASLPAATKLPLVTNLPPVATLPLEGNLPPVQPMLINKLGACVSNGTWRIGVFQSGSFLSFTHHEISEGEGWSNSVWSTINPDGWQAHAGWFVFIENETRVWAYDGDRLLILDDEKPGERATYFNHFPCAVPAEVFAHLSEQKKQEFEKRTEL